MEKKVQYPLKTHPDVKKSMSALAKLAERPLSAYTEETLKKHIAKQEVKPEAKREYEG